MKKIILFISFALIFCVSAYCQSGRQANPDYKVEDSPMTEQQLMRAGWHLKRFSGLYYTGTGLIIGGAVMSVAGAGSNNTMLITVSSLAMLSGMVVQLVSHSHIGKAGRNLMGDPYASRIQLSGTENGIGLVYKF